MSMLSEPLVIREERNSIELRQKDGKKLFGVLHRPLVDKPAPALLICSGFAGTKCGKYRILVRLAQALAEAGIAVLRFDYRGAGDSEGDFEHVTLSTHIEDTVFMLRHLSADPLLDRSRIGILGRSMGGAVAVSAAAQVGWIKSMALWAPVFNGAPWREWMLRANPNPSGTLGIQWGKENFLEIPNREFIRELFTMNLLPDLTHLQQVPLLHIQGKQDALVTLQHAEEYRKARENAIQTVFIELSRSDHDFSDSEERSLLLAETLEWFKNTL